MKTKKLALTAILISLSLVLSYAEKLLPAFIPIPGVKIGLANIAVVFALYKLGIKEAFAVSIFRVLLSALLFGTLLSLAYSFAGAFVSLIVMALLKKTSLFSPVSVSVVGGILHNLAQIFVASLIVGSDVLKYYAPVLILSGVIAGLVIGLVSAVLVRRVEIE